MAPKIDTVNWNENVRWEYFVFGHLTNSNRSFGPIMQCMCYNHGICLEVFPEENMIEVEHFLYQNKLYAQLHIAQAPI